MGYIALLSAVGDYLDQPHGSPEAAASLADLIHEYDVVVGTLNHGD